MSIQALAGFAINLEICWNNISLPYNNRCNAGGDFHLSGTSLDIAVALQQCGVAVKLIGAVGREDQLDLAGLIYKDLDRRCLPHILLPLRKQTAIASIEVASGRHLSFKPEMRGTTKIAIEQMVRDYQPQLQIVSGLMADEEEVDFASRFFRAGCGLKVLNFRRAFVSKSWELLRAIAKLTDLLCLNRYEAAAFLSCEVDQVGLQNIDSLLKLGPKMVIVTKDRDGALSVDQNGTRLSVPAYEAGRRVDPSGAGDCFLAYFLDAWLKHQPLSQALKQASVAAVIKVTRLGAHNMPSFEEVAKVIAVTSQL